jgi:hypothetical protein
MALSSSVTKAITTPLASIFGSGFLIIVPILAGAVGRYSVIAMVGVCALAIAVGSVIRFNIRNAEPVLAHKPPESTLSHERASDLVLTFAYVISVSLYLHILASFVLGGFGADTELNKNLLTTAVIGMIMLIGMTKGLGPLEFLETWALWITFAIIALLLAGFAYFDWNAWHSSAGIQKPTPLEHTRGAEQPKLQVTRSWVKGIVYNRVHGAEFDAETRIKASRWSQIISTAVYIAFVALALPLTHLLHGKYDDNSLIELAKFASPLLVTPLVIAAALSQFSAAVADTTSATGNMEEVTNQHLKAKSGYILIGGGAIALTWSASTLELTALASRAFAFYYLLQCLVAFTVSKSSAQKLGILVLAAALAFITVFAVPAG